MPPQNNGNVPPKSSKTLVVVSVVLLLLAVVVAGVFYFLNTKSGKVDNIVVDEKKEEIEQVDTPVGQIFLTTSGEQFRDDLDIYSFDLVTEDIQEVFTPGIYERVTASLNESMDSLVYARVMTYDEQKKKYGDIDYADMDEYVVASFKLGDVNDEKVLVDNWETDTNWFRWVPKMSPDESKIAYQSRIPEGNNRIPNDWTVSMVELLSNETVKLGNGMFPAWGPDNNTVLALRNDGVVAYIPTDEGVSETQVLSVDASYVTHGARLALSDDKTQMALIETDSTNLGYSLVIYKIDSWDPVQATEVKKIETKSEPGFPVFSPDGKYIAILQVKRNPSTLEPIGLEIVIYDLLTDDAFTYEIPNEPSIGRTFLDDWRY